MEEFQFWSPAEATQTEKERPVEQLLGALYHLGESARTLEESECADPREVTRAEVTTLEAIGRADEALLALLRQEPHLVERERLAEIREELDEAFGVHRRLAAARSNGDGVTMLRAARSLRRAAAFMIALCRAAGIRATGSAGSDGLPGRGDA